jgi:polysaccharide pyruvyl transferase WcaK-like protein
MNLVVPFGFYGYGNTGDEATLAGFARLLSHDGASVRVFVASRNRAQTKRAAPTFTYFDPSGRDLRRWFAKLTCSAHVMAGGTPIQDVLGEWPLSEVLPLVRSIDRWRVPLSFVGVGVESLRLEQSRQVVKEHIIPRVRHWSVRSTKDRDRLIQWGAAPAVVTVAADMAWLLAPVSDDSGRSLLSRWGLDLSRPVIGVNLVNENLVFDRYPDMAGALARALDDLADETNATVLFVSQESRHGPTFDRAAATHVASRMRAADRVFIAPNDYFAPPELMAIISCCCLTITMRYHFCVFSALQQVPFLAIQRCDKLADLCWDLDWTAKLVPPNFDATQITDHVRALRRLSVRTERLAQRVAQMKQRALQNRVALDALTADGFRRLSIGA